MSLFWRKPQVSVHEKFWKWFLNNETNLLNFEAGQEATFNKLSAALSNVDPDLTFEFGPPMPKREFVISAGGIKRAFPAVVALAGAAPKLPNWQVTAFRPRRTPLNLIELGGIHVDPNEVQFSLLDNGEKAGVYLYIPGYAKEDIRYGQIGYLLLDEALGEFDVESRLGLIKMLSPDEVSDATRYPLVELPALFDHLTAKLEKRTGKPS
ncbi:hypothetical protein [Granulicella aggregans]|jgi:hypothetical protein|uniref:hypothetical protein n=1 Tax=Granulicella aggregans TaxID=474949 RepID=UPI0021DF5D06|nr:hypothetical protein [Granulicella aggregans]